MKVAVLAPIASSLYARTVIWLLCREPGISLELVLVRNPWTLARIRSEWRRDGSRLLRKVAQKMVLGDQRFASLEGTLLELARDAGVPPGTLHDLAKPCSLQVVTVDDHNSDRSIALMTGDQPDVVVFTGGGLLRPPLLAIPRLGTLNCHMGPLPQYRGMDVVEWPALESAVADPGIGVTLHYIDSGVDTGPILLRQRTELRSTDDFASIRRRMERQMALLMVEGVRGLRDGRLTPQPQQSADGRQYFVMHPQLLEIARRRLRSQLDLLCSASVPDRTLRAGGAPPEVAEDQSS